MWGLIWPPLGFFWASPGVSGEGVVPCKAAPLPRPECSHKALFQEEQQAEGRGRARHTSVVWNLNDFIIWKYANYWGDSQFPFGDLKRRAY